MANPPYPPQGMPPGMGMPPNPGMPGMPGMPGPMPPRPGIPVAGTVKKGTPRIVPIIVSAGVAVGVFCGLYFGVGVPEESEADTEDTPALHTAPQGPKSAAAASNEVTNFKSGSAKPAPGSGSAPAPGSGSAAVVAGSGSAAAGSAAGSGSGSATPGAGSGSAAPATDNTVDLLFATTPPNATVTVDGKLVKDGKLSLALAGDTKTVKIVAKAAGHKTWEKQATIKKENAEERFEIKLVKRGRSRPSGDRGDRDHEPPGGLIDL